jgi:catechol 2,3-dioxygenase-like lactoylglutathione lyase family enzyme
MTGVRGLSGWLGVVLDAPDPLALAHFYRDLLGWEIAVGDDPSFVAMRMPGHPANLAFQLEEQYRRPVWPAAPGEQLMMLHLDIGVSGDLAEAVEDALALGAELPDHQPQQDVRVLLDPAGHPFCLYIDRD